MSGLPPQDFAPEAAGFPEQGLPAPQQNPEQPQQPQERVPQDESESVTIAKAVDGLQSPDFDVMLQNVIVLRKLLSRPQNPPAQEIFDLAAVPVLTDMLSDDAHAKLQLEALWALTNIASTNLTRYLTINDPPLCRNIIPQAVRLLQSPSSDVAEQAVWCIGNIAGDNPQFRDSILTIDDILPSLVRLLQGGPAVTLVRNVVWVMSNLVRGKPRVAWGHAAPFIPVLAQLISASTDEEVLTDAAWALSYISDGEDERGAAVVAAGVIPRLVSLARASATYRVPALRTLGNIVTGDDRSTQAVIDAGVIPVLMALFTSNKETVRKESCWAASNIAAGNRDQVATLCDTPGLVDTIVSIITSADNSFAVKKEACWVLSNATSGGAIELLLRLADQHAVVAALVTMLPASDLRIVLVALEGLENLVCRPTKAVESNEITGEELAAYIERMQGYLVESGATDFLMADIDNNDVSAKLENIRNHVGMIRTDQENA